MSGLTHEREAILRQTCRKNIRGYPRVYLSRGISSQRGETLRGIPRKPRPFMLGYLSGTRANLEGTDRGTRKRRRSEWKAELRVQFAVIDSAGAAALAALIALNPGDKRRTRLPKNPRIRTPRASRYACFPIRVDEHFPSHSLYLSPERDRERGW